MRSFYSFSVKALLLLCFVFFAGLSLQAQTTTYSSSGVQQGLVKVKFKPTMASTLSRMKVQTRGNTVKTGIASLDNTAKSLKATSFTRLFPYNAAIEHKLKKHGLDLWYVLEMDNEVDLDLAISSLQELDEVLIAESSYEKVIEPTTYTPYEGKPQLSRANLPFNDPLLGDQWHYYNSGQTGHPNGAHINLFEAWKTVTGRGNIIISVHDEGIDVEHIDLKENIWVNLKELNGIEGVDDDGNGYIDDIHGFNFLTGSGIISKRPHGTHVAGTIAAVNNNGIGVSGVAGGSGKNDGVKIMAVEILGGPAFIERSFIYAAQNGAVISQNSWGYSYVNQVEQSVLDAIDYFIAEAGDYPNSPMKGGIVIFAAGNDKNDGAWYPGRYESTLSVAALAPNWKKAIYSNFGTWVDIAAPGGDKTYGNHNMVLSTLPNDQYGYDNGTSMACPHVSGVAALILAKSKGQMSNEVLWNKLLTGTLKDILYENNPDFIGKLGVGAIDAAFAVSDNTGTAPLKITDLKIAAAAPTFATISWKVPVDEDDSYPASFSFYHSTSEITEANIADLQYILIKNADQAGTEITYEIDDLSTAQQYWFAVTSTDRWNNTSVLSNVITISTDQNPELAVTETEINHTVDMSVSPTTSSIVNLTNLDTNAASLLRWTSDVRTLKLTLDNKEYARTLPKYAIRKADASQIGMVAAGEENKTLRGEKASTFATIYAPKNLKYFTTNAAYIGELEIDYPTSSAVKFIVNDKEGFNLTQVKFYLSYTLGRGKTTLEIYKDELKDNNLIARKDCTPTLTTKSERTISLDEHLFFANGETFFIVVHAEPGTLYPLGTGRPLDSSSLPHNYYSTDMGQTWVLLHTVTNNLVWSTTAVSQIEPFGKQVTLSPSSGDVLGGQKNQTTVTSDGSPLRNGTYTANLAFTSNTIKEEVLKVPYKLIVKGQKPNLNYPLSVDFGSVFHGESKTIDIVFENQGYGSAASLTWSVDDRNNFKLSSTSVGTINALAEKKMSVTFNPVDAGGINGVITIKNNNQTHTISLFGVGLETSAIEVTPLEQDVVVNVIGDKASADIMVENVGKYPLKYFIPGFDDKSVSAGWPTKYHKYGYNMRSIKDVDNPLVFDFDDIRTTGVDISKYFIDPEMYKTVELPFEFPFYDTPQKEVQITVAGLITFDNTVRAPVSPNVGIPSEPKGFISVFGQRIYFMNPNSAMHYEVRPDRFILQYTEVCYDRIFNDLTKIYTAQVVLHRNGDIRFYYKKGPTNTFYTSILIEDLTKKDALIIKDIRGSIDLANTAYGYDYPGPSIIESVDNGAKIVAPGRTETIKVHMDTKSLTEGITRRYINIVSNDPKKPNVLSLINLDVRGGGKSNVTVSETEYDFGIIYKGFPYTHIVEIANSGNKDTKIESFTFANNKFAITGNLDLVAKLAEKYTLSANTDVTGKVEDKLTIKLGDGSTRTITLKSEIILPPVVTTNLSPLEETLSIGDTKTHDFELTNTGETDLDLSIMGTPWAIFRENESAAPMLNKYAYKYEIHNKGEPTYNWIDIIKSGTHVPELLEETPYLVWGWKTLALPFTFTYYGKDYNEIKITGNGIVSFDEAPLKQLEPLDPLPYPGGAFIMPFWFSAAENPSAIPGKTTGLFYQTFNSKDKTDKDVKNHDMLVISWENMISMTGVGDGISFQLILFDTGNFHMQHRIYTGNHNDLITMRGIVGLQNGKDEYTTISERVYFNMGLGHSILLSPSNEYTIPKGGKIGGTLTFDSRPIYAGIFTDALKIQSNDPTGELKEKPLKLTVIGKADISVPTLIDFEQQQKRADKYELFIPVKNTGSTILQITKLANNGDRYAELTTEVMYQGTSGIPDWTNILALPNPQPTFDIRPGETFNIKVTLAPNKVGTYTNFLKITTELGEHHVDIKGAIYESAVLELDKKLISERSDDNAPITGQVTVSNKGDYKLDYTTSILYMRGIAQSSSEPSASANNQNPIRLQSAPVDVEPSDRRINVAKSTYSTYSEPIIMAHTGVETISRFDGVTGGSQKGVYATRYTAGEEGYNLSDVFTYFRGEGIREGIIEVEIKAGNSNVILATSLGKGTIPYYSDKEDSEGGWYQLTLKEPISMYPYEDFFVIFTYPKPLIAPQGAAFNAEKIEHVENRYLTLFENTWFDIQVALKQYYNGGWVMAVGERAKSKIGWLNILSHSTATIPIAESKVVELEILPAATKPGDHSAIVTFASNDMFKPAQKLTVNLHINEAPKFQDAPTSLYVLETQTDVTEITVVDVENDEFTVEAIELPKFTTFKYDEATKTITLTSKPKAGDKGSYTIKLKVTDTTGKTRELEIPVIVNNVNHAPVFTGEITEISLSTSGGIQQFNIESLFTDPDGDALAYAVQSSDPQIVKVQQGGGVFFTLEGLDVGTAQVAFVVSDPYNATATEIVTVTVSSCRNVEHLVLQKWNSVLLVDNSRTKYVANGYQWYKNGIPLPGETNAYYTTEELDFTASYHVMITTMEGEVFYTCSIIPERRDHGLKVYPNPVKPGQAITIEANIETIEGKPVTARLINLHGNVLQEFTVNSSHKTFDAPASAGVYLLRFEIADGVNKTFKLLVK